MRINQKGLDVSPLVGTRRYIAAQATSASHENNGNGNGNRNGNHYPAIRPTVTISRETGAGAVTIAGLVAELLSGLDPAATPWSVFDRNLVEQALKENELPETLKGFMPEDVTPELQSAFEELLGLHPPTWSLFQAVSKTILRLAQAGNVVLVGRGANLITAPLSHVLHVRLIAPVEKRVKTAAQTYGLGLAEASTFVRKTDRARARYVAGYFEKRIDDPLQYHLTINTGFVSFETAARLIADAVESSVLSANAAST
jgi:cytidylate kinase